MPKKTPLVTQYLENVSRKVLEDYQEIIRQYVRGTEGIYALFRRGKLYYVGLASNLNSRLKQHLKDQHKDSWDRFSVYLTIHSEHMRELEALLLRITKPSGNKQTATFAASDNLETPLNRYIKTKQDEERDRLFDRKQKRARPKRKARPKKRTRGEPMLAPYIRADVMPSRKLKADYKGKTLQANVLKGGQISFRGKRYKSPSAAAQAAIHSGSRNGWYFWTFERSPNKWVPLNDLKTMSSNTNLRKKRKARRSSRKKAVIGRGTPSLAKYLALGKFRTKVLKGAYKGKEFRATLLKDGTISFKKKKFRTPSAAATGAIGKAARSGWHFWTYQKAPRKWVPLADLKK